MVHKATSVALWTGTAAAVLVGLGLAALMLSISSMIGLLVVGGTIAGTVHCVLVPQPRALEPSASVHWAAARMQQLPLCSAVAYGAVVLPSLASIVALLGPATSLAVLGVGVTLRLGFLVLQRTKKQGRDPSPGATRIPLARLGTESWESADSASAAWFVGEDLTRWSDEQLCWAWRVSYGQLAHAPGHHLERLALQRRRYLDELERRNPTRFAAWLSSGARAPSNPARYITSATLPGPHVSSDPGIPRTQEGPRRATPDPARPTGRHELHRMSGDHPVTANPKEITDDQHTRGPVPAQRRRPGRGT